MDFPSHLIVKEVNVGDVFQLRAGEQVLVHFTFTADQYAFVQQGVSNGHLALFNEDQSLYLEKDNTNSVTYDLANTFIDQFDDLFGGSYYAYFSSSVDSFFGIFDDFVVLPESVNFENYLNAPFAIQSNATVFTQADVDLAVSSALVDVISNLDGIDISSSSHTATFSKTKVDYTAFSFDKKITGNALANKIVTSPNGTTVSAGEGNDTIDGGIGNDSIDGGKSADSINAGDGNNVVTGGFGIDSIVSGSGNDKIDGGDDNDTINAGDGLNTVTGGKGDDSITVGLGNDKIDAGEGNDTINAGDGNNTVTGGKGVDLITTGAGNDKIDAGSGADSIVSGDGNDSVSGGDDNDFIYGWHGSDSLTGGAGNDTIDGGTGNDKIDGGAGVDRLIAGFGNDTLTGGADADTFVLSISSGLDTVTDFKSTVDKLVFTDSPTPTALDSSHFVTSITNSFNFTAVDSYGYNTKTGAFFHDVDGAGGVDAVQIALIANKPVLVFTDILI